MKFYLVTFKWNLESVSHPSELDQSRVTLWSTVPKNPDYVVVGEAEFDPLWYGEDRIVAGRIEKLEIKREELAERYYADRKHVQDEIDSLLAIRYQPEAEDADFDEEIPF